MDNLTNLCSFFKNSPKRQRYFENFTEFYRETLNLSETRYFERYKAYETYLLSIIDKFTMMANLSIINILPNRVADIYIKLKSITSKLHNTSASIAFIKEALFLDVIPKFAIAKWQFINKIYYLLQFKATVSTLESICEKQLYEEFYESLENKYSEKWTWNRYKQQHKGCLRQRDHFSIFCHSPSFSML